MLGLSFMHIFVGYEGFGHTFQVCRFIPCLDYQVIDIGLHITPDLRAKTILMVLSYK